MQIFVMMIVDTLLVMPCQLFRQAEENGGGGMGRARGGGDTHTGEWKGHRRVCVCVCMWIDRKTLSTTRTGGDTVTVLLLSHTLAILSNRTKRAPTRLVTGTRVTVVVRIPLPFPHLSLSLLRSKEIALFIAAFVGFLVFTLTDFSCNNPTTMKNGAKVACAAVFRVCFRRGFTAQRVLPHRLLSVAPPTHLIASGLPEKVVRVTRQGRQPPRLASVLQTLVPAKIHRANDSKILHELAPLCKKQSTAIIRVDLLKPNFLYNS